MKALQQHPSATIIFPTAVLLISLASLLMLLTLPAAAAPQTRYVDGAGGLDSGGCAGAANPCQTISYALDQALDGDTIKVAQGTYQENLAISGNIDLLGGFDPADWEAAPALYGSIIDGRRLGSVVTYDGEFAGTLGGFKITAGKAELGGGIFIDMAAPDLQNLWIVDNEAADSGGGIYLNQGRVSISDSKLQNNKAANFGGALHITTSSSDLANLDITGNTAGSGGGLSLDNTGRVKLNSSELAQNEGTSQSGAIHVVDGLLEIDRSVLAANTALDHGGVLTAEGSFIKVTNSLIHGNSTTSGVAGVLAFSASEVFFVNSTIAGNAPQNQQAILLWGSTGSLNLTNTIMWNNSLNLQADPPCDACFNVKYSDVQGYSGGDNNIDADPLFRNPGTADFRLKTNSPAIDAGTSSGAPVADLDGTLRDENPDMGAYEYIKVLYTEQAFLPALLKN